MVTIKTVINKEEIDLAVTGEMTTLDGRIVKEVDLAISKKTTRCRLLLVDLSGFLLEWKK